MKIIPLQQPVAKTIDIPGSKSYTNRALFLAALTEKKVTIINPLVSEDTEAMIRCLRALGVNVHVGNNYIEIFPGHPEFLPACRQGISGSKMLKQEMPKPRQTRLKRVRDDNKANNQSYSLSARLSGTTMRFILALACIIPGVKTVSGEEGLNNRPIGDLVDALIQMGAKIEYLGKKGYPPVKILSSKLNEGTVKIKGSVSSQFISSLLMIAPKVGSVEIEVLGDQISKQYIDMTIDTMKQFGANVINNNYKSYKMFKQKYNGKEYSVEGDFSSASYFFAIAALTGSTITIQNLNPYSLQADREFLQILEKMGNKILYKKNAVTVKGSGKIRPINVNMENCPDQVMTLSVLAAFANGTTIIHGVKSLKIKETDRLLAIKNELKKMGIKTDSSNSTLTIYGGNPKSASIETYGDHRMAMAFAVAGARLSGMEIQNPLVVNKTFPDFWMKLAEIAFPAERDRNDKRRNIVLIGMRGSGKTTVAKLLAEKLQKNHIELDEMLAKKVGMPIALIVEKYGWAYFRKVESDVVKEVAVYSDTIISTGGGVVINTESVSTLKKSGTLVLLDASVETLVKRTGNTKNRPFLTNKKNRKEEIREVLKQRKTLYGQAADEIIATDTLSPKEVVEEILLKL